MGRPTTNPRTEKIGFRMSKDEIDLLNECADEMNTQRVNVVIEGVKMVKEKLETNKKEE
jgi:hypothetical protein